MTFYLIVVYACTLNHAQSINQSMPVFIQISSDILRTVSYIGWFLPRDAL